MRKLLVADSSKEGQIKIQQMAFVLVATMIFFAIIGTVYVSIQSASLKSDVTQLRRESAIQTVQKLTGTPEFSWTASDDCNACIDLDKVYALKNLTTYQNFWQSINFLQISRVYPQHETIECTDKSYPRCNTITIIEEENYEAHEAYVSLCRYDNTHKTTKCELGKVLMGFETLG